MMKRLLVLSLITLLSLPLAIYAADEKAPTPRKHTWELGTEISHITYREPHLMKETGVMYGVVGSYTYRGWLPPSPEEMDKAMLKIEGKGSWGKVDYSSPISGTMENIPNWLLEFRGLLGYDFAVNTFTLTPYLGVGYRYLNDDSSGKVTSLDDLGYERESNYIYIPIGTEVTTPFNNWLVGATLEYDIFCWGKQKSHLSDARLWDPIWGYYTFPDIENRQKKGYGIRGSIKFQKKGERLNFVIEPYIRYWNIKRSKVVTTSTISENGLWIITGSFVEPKNNSTEAGCRLAVNF